MAFEPTALLDFAAREGRLSELGWLDARDVVVKPGGGAAGAHPARRNRAHGRAAPRSWSDVLEQTAARDAVSVWLPTTDLSEHAALLKALPSSSLFRDFCASLEAKLPHRWLRGAATAVCKHPNTGFRVHFRAADGRERKVVARAVILATGPVGKWNVPAPFEAHLGCRRIVHTEALMPSSGRGTLREEVTALCAGDAARVLVIGGGISAAQAAIAAVRAGRRVVLRSRRPLQTRAFDVASEWLDVRHADRLRYEFLSQPVRKRREAVREATAGGSVPAIYLDELRRLAHETNDLRLEVDEGVDRSEVRVGGEHVVVNGETFGLVVLATGVVTATDCSPLYASVGALLEAPTVDGLPHVDSSLRWAPEEDVFVVGANAALELGPGAANLIGAMRGARVVANELFRRMWRQPDGRLVAPKRSAFANKFAGLWFCDPLLDGTESEIDVLVERLHLAPKVEAKLRRASRGSRGVQ